MFHILSVWGIAYGGVQPKGLLEHLGKRPDFEGHVLICPEHLDGCRVIAWMHKDTGFFQLPGSPVGGPATALFWCAGQVDDQEPADFWREHNFAQDGYVALFDGLAEFRGGTLYLRGRCQGRFAHITEGCFFLVKPQVEEGDKDIITGDSYPVVVEEC
jgi:hypothetical protein